MHLLAAEVTFDLNTLLLACVLGGGGLFCKMILAKIEKASLDVEKIGADVSAIRVDVAAHGARLNAHDGVLETMRQ